MINQTEHLLICVAEECNEVAQRVSKALRFGLTEVQAGQDRTNAERIMDEFIDLTVVLAMLAAAGHLNMDPSNMEPKLKAKVAKVEKYMTIAREQGMLS